MPFGEEIASTIGGRSSVPGYGAADSTRQKFTSKERDNESGLDYFLARYYSSAQGRFTSVDPENAGTRPDDPQSWNGYAYGRNNPMLYVDRDGTTYRLYDANGNYQDISDENADQWRKQDGVVFKKGKIFDKDGNQLGTYRRTWDDSASLNFNLFIYGREGMVARAPAMNQAIAGFAVGTAVVGATGGAAAYLGGVALGGSSITTLGLEATTTTGAVTGTTTAATVAPQAASAIRNALTGFTKHGINQAISRNGVGVSTRAILDALKNPIKVIAQSEGRIKIVGKDAIVVLNQAGKVITTWARSSAGKRIQP